ncbi:MAG: pyridinium-3,5-bisthiocarboxylic acid mononucleotide nickel chelatase, partial [Frankiales bacterium]|nr:pyridinium-3,5-bisthiocarboxylic acid mononucleotide nickel chelatase [Frankiales bacterium]
MTTIGWWHCSAGASGDMMLGALVDAGVPLGTLQAAVDAVGTEPVTLLSSPVKRHGIGATLVMVDAPRTATDRSWAGIRSLLEAAALTDGVRALALDAFARLAAAEASVHRTPVDDVHFHEVGGLDAIADIVGTAAGIAALGLGAITSSPVTLGYGSARGEHGVLPVPGPAVLALLSSAQAPVESGPAPYEMCTPTG